MKIDPNCIDPSAIDQTLDRIALGQLDPLTAARRLLGIAPLPDLEPSQGQWQTLESLIRALGMPPPEIELDWRRQMQSLADDWQQTYGVPLPPLELSDVWVDGNNRLSLRHTRHTAATVADESSQVSTPAIPAAAKPDELAAEPATPSSRKRTPAAPLPITWRKRALVAAAAGAVIVLVTSRYFLADPELSDTSADATERSLASSRRPLSAAEDATANSHQPLTASSSIRQPLPTPQRPADEPANEIDEDLLATESLMLGNVLPDFAAAGVETDDSRLPEDLPLAIPSATAAPTTAQVAPANATAAEGTSSSPAVDPSPQSLAAWDVSMRFHFTEPQASATWPLTIPSESSTEQFAVEVEVPETVQLAWIEPLDTQNWRRSRGLLQWTPQGAEWPQIGCRLELRVATNLSLKLRYAAQLDPSLPWQTFSPEQLENAVDRANAMLPRLLAQQSELARQYTAASSANRRMLKPAKDAVDQNVQRLQTLTQRLQQLIELQADVANHARLRIKRITQ